MTPATDAASPWQHTVVKAFATLQGAYPTIAIQGHPRFDEEQLRSALMAIGAGNSAITYKTQQIGATPGGVPHVRHQLAVSWNGDTSPEAVHAAMNIELYNMGFGENPGQWTTAFYDPHAPQATIAQRG